MESLPEVDLESGYAIHLELSLYGSTQPRRHFQSEHTGPRLSAYSSGTGLLRFRAAGWASLSSGRHLGSAVRIRHGLVRAVGHYHAVYDPAISVCANLGTTVSGQHSRRIPLGRRSHGPSHLPQPQFRTRPGSFWRRSQRGFRLLAAVEPFGTKDHREGLEF